MATLPREISCTMRDFADDMVADVSFRRLRCLFWVLRAFKEGEREALRISGSRWNLGKTKLSPVRRLRRSDALLVWRSLLALQWVSVEVVGKFKYLGIWTGLDVSLKLIFADSLEKL